MVDLLITKHAVNTPNNQPNKYNKLAKTMLSLGLLGSLEIVATQSVMAAVPETDTNNGFAIEEVVITARKRQESVQNTPLSVAAFTGNALEQRGINDVADMAQMVPNLVFDSSPPISGNSAAAAVFIRGVGQLDFTINVDPGVGTYVDGVYMARSVGGIIDLLDLERIEVLRGPQGTLFGRNTIGGAIQLLSKAPANELGGYVSATVGTGNRADVQGVLNVPLTDTLLSKVSVMSRNRDGYVYDGNGTDLGNDDSISARFQLHWDASENMTVALNMDMTRDRENGSANTALELYADTPIPLRANTGPSGEGTAAGCTPATFNSSRNCFGPAWLTGDRNRTESTFPAKSNNDIAGASLTLNYDANWGTIKSITAWRELESDFQRDSDHSPFNIFATSNKQEQDQFSQELQFLGDSIKDTLHWVMGAYYFEESATDLTQIYLPAPPGVPIIGVFDNNVENDNWAIYGEATYDFTANAHLTLGTRYTDENKFYSTLQNFVPQAAPHIVLVTLVDDAGSSANFTETTSRATFSYDISDLLMTYATYSEGFKSGGFNPRYLAPTQGRKAIPFQPEYVTLYELGIKYVNDANTLQINGALFTNNYEDIQISTNPDFTGGATITQNAAEADISGMELEFTWIPNAQLLVEGGMGYLDASYNKLSSDVQFPESNKFARIPEWSANLAASYIVELKGGATVTPRIDWSYTSDTQGTAENGAAVAQDAFQVVNANIAFADASNTWKVVAGVTNLTDQDYLLSANQNQRLGYAEGVFAREREWYIKVKRHF